MTLSSERRETIEQIRNSLEFLSSEDRTAVVRRSRHTELGFDADEWQTIAELGLLGIRVPEDRGGAGLGLTEAVAVAEELGRHLAPHALVNAIAAAPLLPQTILGSALAGERIVIPAWQEDPIDPLAVHATARNGVISGSKSFIPYARAASDFIVRTDAGFFCVAKDAAGLRIRTDRLHDGSHFGSLQFDNVSGEPCQDHVGDAVTEMFLCNAGYMLGAAQRGFELTLDYIKIREQFGRPIGSFQALQHRAVDMLLELSLLRASLTRLTLRIDDGAKPATAAPAVARVMARASTSLMSVTRRGVQMHGGIGFTDEADMGLYLRKAMVMANALGSPKWHRQRYAALIDIANNRLAA